MRKIKTILAGLLLGAMPAICLQTLRVHAQCNTTPGNAICPGTFSTCPPQNSRQCGVLSQPGSGFNPTNGLFDCPTGGGANVQCTNGGPLTNCVRKGSCQWNTTAGACQFQSGLAWVWQQKARKASAACGT